MTNLVVTGPESSGTRFVSRWLEAHPDITARHWSMPSGTHWARHWPTEHDYDGEPPDALVLCVRSFEATIASQLHRQMVTTRAEAEANIVTAHMRALTWAVSHGIPVYPLTYDLVVTSPTTFDAVFQWLDLDPVDCPVPVIDANAKWLDPQPQPHPDNDQPRDPPTP